MSRRLAAWGLTLALMAVIAAAVIGASLLAFAAGRFAWEIRRRRRLLKPFAELAEFDGDIHRYLRRNYLLRADWSPRAGESSGVRADAIFEEMLERSRRTRDCRAKGSDAAEEIAALISLEHELETTLG